MKSLSFARAGLGLVWVIVVYGALLAWAASGEYLGLGMLLLGVMLERRIHQQEEMILHLRTDLHNSHRQLTEIIRGYED